MARHLASREASGAGGVWQKKLTLYGLDVWFDGRGRGVHSRPWSLSPARGWSGSTRGVCSPRSGDPAPRSRHSTMPQAAVASFNRLGRDHPGALQLRLPHPMSGLW